MFFNDQWIRPDTRPPLEVAEDLILQQAAKQGLAMVATHLRPGGSKATRVAWVEGHSIWVKVAPIMPQTIIDRVTRDDREGLRHYVVRLDPETDTAISGSRHGRLRFLVEEKYLNALPPLPEAGLEEDSRPQGVVAQFGWALRQGPVIVEVSAQGEFSFWSPRVTEGAWVLLPQDMSESLQASGFSVTPGTRTIRLRADDQIGLREQQVIAIGDYRPQSVPPLPWDMTANYYDYRGMVVNDEGLRQQPDGESRWGQRHVILADNAAAGAFDRWYGTASGRPRIIGLSAAAMATPLDRVTLAWLLRASTLIDQKGMLLIQSFRVDQGALYITTAA